MESVNNPTPAKHSIESFLSDEEMKEKDELECIELVTSSTEKLAETLDTFVMPTSIEGMYSIVGEKLSHIEMPESIKLMIEGEYRHHSLDQITIDYSSQAECSQAVIVVQYYLKRKPSIDGDKESTKLINSHQPSEAMDATIMDITGERVASSPFPLNDESEFYRLLATVMTQDNIELAKFIQRFDESAYKEFVHNPFAYKEVMKQLDFSTTNSLVKSHYQIEDPVSMIPVSVLTQKYNNETFLVDFDLADSCDGTSWVRLCSTDNVEADGEVEDDDIDRDFFAIEGSSNSYQTPQPYRHSNLTFSYLEDENETAYNPSIEDFKAIADVQQHIVDAYLLD